MIASLVGTPYFPRVDGGILFVEDVAEHPYRIERMFHQLHYAGVLERQRAVLVGAFTGYELAEHDNGYDLDAAIAQVGHLCRVPIVTGLMLGSFLSSRLAGRASQSTTAKIGFGLSLFGALANLIHNLAVDHLALPWAVIPLGFAAAGIGTAFPLLTILMLDMYPRHRGSAASIQAFTSLSINALIAGALAPLLAPHRLGLAWVSLSMCAAAIALWWRYRRGIRRDPVLPRTRPMIDKAEQL